MSKKFLNIVVADDDSDDQLLVKQAIEEIGAGHIILSVFNGLELLEILEYRVRANVELPDFILLDINMPLLNGFSSLKRIRENDAFKQIPVFILTTSHSRTDQLMAKQLGANGFYTKPILFEQLKQILGEIVEYAEVEH